MKTILVDAINCLILKNEGIFEKMHALLQSYPNRKIIVSNANDEQIKQFGLNNVPYELFTLKHFPEKTDSKYFEILLQKFKLTQNQVVYFEHNIDAVNSARKIGITSYYYSSEKKDLDALKQFLDKNL